MITKYILAGDIINSIRFYFMLSIVCMKNDFFVGDPSFQLNSFLKELEIEGHYTKEKIKYYIQLACDSLPAGFLKHYEIEPLMRR